MAFSLECGLDVGRNSFSREERGCLNCAYFVEDKILSLIMNNQTINIEHYSRKHLSGYQDENHTLFEGLHF